MNLTKSVKRVVAVLLVVAVTLLAVRIYDSQGGAPLKPWHLHVPHELTATELDATEWPGYLEAEGKVFEHVRTEVTQRLPEEDRIPADRYFEGSPVYPGRFTQNFNRSYVLEPEGVPAGAVVVLHGLTGSPYDLRHFANAYRAHGFVAVVVRLPGHGTVPGGLTRVRWEDWMAATRLAVREARRLTGPSKPLQIVGFSTGAALALKYALEALGSETLARPDRLVLISPMIGITSFARFAGLAGLPAILPPFAKAAWLSVVPEFSPFKYNSFPVNGALQAHRLTVALQSDITRAERDGRLDRLPPILTFQSVLDFTVHTRAVVSALYERLPAKGHELVLFDVNRSADLSALLRTASETKLSRLLAPPPRRFRTVVITNAGPDTREVVAKILDPGEVTERIVPLALSYPADVYSLSHVAVPFPPWDPLYGMQPDGSEDFGIHLGAMASRGERGALILSLDSLMRASSNPFFPYMMGRVEEGMAPSSPAAPPTP